MGRELALIHKIIVLIDFIDFIYRIYINFHYLNDPSWNYRLNERVDIFYSFGFVLSIHILKYSLRLDAWYYFAVYLSVCLFT